MPTRLRVAISAETPDCIPQYATDLASGMDLRANECVEIPPGGRVAVGTGIRIAVPEGYEAQVRPRSGMALKQGLSVPNAPGTIDADYRGEVKVILINLGREPVKIAKGDRIAQLVVAPVVKVEWEPCAELPGTDRGDGGFGSTGTT
ncbi:MAG: dUTP diphosphatase [Fimbriimonadales bacterium]|nr:dUTP diphosphatase [Fimbriimonadales bacterium]